MSSPAEPDLTTAAGRLAQDVQTLAGEVVTLRHRLTQSRRLIAVAITGLVLDIALTLVVGLLFHLVDTNSNHIQGVQTRVGNQVLCPLYKIFLDSYNPHSPTAKLDPAKYEAQFNVIRHSYTVLACKK